MLAGRARFYTLPSPLAALPTCLVNAFATFIAQLEQSALCRIQLNSKHRQKGEGFHACMPALVDYGLGDMIEVIDAVCV